jgi:hypothetical protein
MTTPTDDTAPPPANASLPDVIADVGTAERDEPEFENDHADAFNDLHASLVRTVERTRATAGLLALLGAVTLRRLWQLGHVATYLAVIALCLFAGAGVAWTLAQRLVRSAASVSAVTHTKGRDVTHALEALRRMHDAFRAMGAALVACTALVLIALATQLTRR